MSSSEEGSLEDQNAREEFLNTIGYHFKQVNKDDMVSDFLILPQGSDLHDHPLVANGSIFLQVRKASSMVEADLDPKPRWEVHAILLDPSSSGYGTVAVRLDPLLSPYVEETAFGDDLE
ncbi:putative 28S rRNA (cytosine-C(5))-methyltransferase isoform X3 [Cucumis melo var. makuwa]|uniref:28S rRNA (Cytosine-C(5))-methyltransferase isoform X3 n=1 Tax=Cucumis melo var. makuwa TaxID=1194695 RepID=A0A5A7V1H0_CUCMM|nr:putative 28S rRNA (cytosine-C(5))-methyltransferase isoform X3 [Cucumis melo var. makuwa]TYK14124.1 putative 28S rRNA (cytosine-C(5))-methyltransferase isoform X3 [Cucumis melo var. makuwa]